jgi:hypothetical protein
MLSTAMPSYHKTGFGRFSVDPTGETARTYQELDDIPVFIFCLSGMGDTEDHGQDRQLLACRQSIGSQ